MLAWRHLVEISQEKSRQESDGSLQTTYDPKGQMAAEWGYTLPKQ